MAYPLPFLDNEFIREAIHGDDAAHTAALVLLKKQKVPLNGNSDLMLWNKVSPIAVAIGITFQTDSERSAKIVESMYLHCGIRSDRALHKDADIREMLWDQSPLWDAAYRMIFPVFETLLVKCDATIDPRSLEQNFPSILHMLAPYGDRAVPFLNLLALHYKGPGVDPNTRNPLCGGVTALHRAISINRYQSPEVIRLLINAFGADPSIPDNRGLLPVDILRTTNDLYSGKGTMVEWNERADKTHRLLTHVERTTAVLMGVFLPERNQESQLRFLDKDLIALIVGFALD